jgi:hypothetical protein
VKHLDLHFYWLRDEVAKGKISVLHLSTDLMPADILTKALSRDKFTHMVSLIGLVHLPTSRGSVAER